VLYSNSTPQRLQDAIRCFAVARALEPSSARPLFFLGNAYRNALDFDSAVRAFREALAIESDYAMAHCCLGMALDEQGMLQETFTSVDRGRLYQEAVASFERGHNIGQKNNWGARSEQWLRKAQQLVELERFFVDCDG
jgi:tetratricopeptide (TPR) repeat protein